MKSNIFHQAAAVGVGAVLLFAVNTANADQPKHKRRAQTEKREDDYSVTPANKSVDGSGNIATRDGKRSTSAQGSQVGGSNGQETRVPTGSHIPQTYHRRAYTTDRDQNAFIYDQNDQRLRSVNNVGDSLRQVPGVTVGGSR